MIAGEVPFRELFHNHFQGQSVLVKAISRTPSGLERSGSLLAFTNRSLIWRDIASLDRANLPSVWPERFSLTDWPASFYSSRLAETSARLCVQVLDACDRLKKIKETPLHKRSDRWTQALETVAGEFLAILDKSREYCSSESPEWQPWTLSTPIPIPSSSILKPGFLGFLGSSLPASRWSSLPSRPIAGSSTLSDDHQTSATYPTRIDIYPSGTIALLWDNIHVASLYTLRALADVGVLATQGSPRALPPLPGPEALHAQMSSTVETIVASIPYLRGDVDELGNIGVKRGRKGANVAVMWLLHRVYRVAGLDPQLKSWILDVFSRIGNQGGLRTALGLRKWYETHSRGQSAP